MMNDIRDSFTYFWECTTGILGDNKAKIIRWSVFAVLLLGIAWSAWYLFDALTVSNSDENDSLNIEAEIRTRQAAVQRENQALKKIAEAAAAINDMRNGGLVIAESLNGMNRRLFNIEGFNDFGLQDVVIPDYSSMLNPEAKEEAHEENQELEQEVHHVVVRAVMVSDKSKIAVVDVDDEKGLIVRLGKELPNGVGRVVRIKSNGLTVRNQNTKQETEFLIK